MANIESFDIISYLEDRQIPFSLKGKNVSRGWLGTACIFCGDTSTHLGVNLARKTISCYKCAETGTVVKYIMELESCTYFQARRIIDQFQDTTYSHLSPTPQRLNAKSTELPSEFSPTITPAYADYLTSRRYDPYTVTKKYDLHFAPIMGNWKFRLIVPVYQSSQIVTWVGRDITGRAEIPYKNAPIEQSVIQAKDTLYNIDTVKDKVIVVEGIFDAWRLGDGAVATFGAKYTQSQIRLLRGLEVAVLFDADAWGQAKKLGYDLMAVAKSVELLSINAKDPDSLSDEDAEKVRKMVGLGRKEE